MSGPEWDFPVSVRQNSDDSIVWGFATGTIASSTPFDFTGASAVLTVTPAEDDATALLQLSSPSSGISFGTSTVNGVVVSTITALFTHDQTKSLAEGMYYYNLLVSNASINGYYALGTFTVNPSVGW